MASLGKWDQTLATPNTPIQNLVKGQANPNQGKFTNAAQKTGAFDIPVLGGLLRGAVQPLTSGAEMVAQAGGETGAALTGQTSAPQFVSPQMQQLLNQRTTAGLDPENANSRQIAMNGVTQAGEAGLDIATLNSLPGAVKNAPEMAKQAPNLLGYLTKGGVGAKIGNAYEKATATGVTDTFSNFATEVKQEIARKLGNGKKYQDIADQILNPEIKALKQGISQNTINIPNEINQINPTTENVITSLFRRMGGVKPGVKGPPGYLKGMSSNVAETGYSGPLRDPIPYSGNTAQLENPNLTPKQLFDLKNQASNRLPSGFLANFKGKSATDQVNEIIRDVAGKRASDITPGVKKLNNIYSAYSKVGSPAKIATNVAVSKLLPEQVKAPFGGDAGVIGGATLLESLLRIGGRL